jgi:hydroxymethylbilane synthase
MGKLDAGDVAATFLAAAGLARLGEEDTGARLDTDAWLPAPAQGAIGLECRTDDTETRRLLSAIDDAPSHAEVMAERALLEGLGGSCHSPIAALATFDGERIAMRAAIFSTDGQERVEGSAEFAPGDLGAARGLAQELLSKASDNVRASFAADAFDE